MAGSRPHLAVYGYFGMGNLGNEASLAALLARVRETRPDVDVSCFAADPVAAGREHGLPAVRLMTYRPGRSGPGAGALKLLSRVWDVPRTFRQLRGVELLVVPGMGVLESSLATVPWGLPFWLFVAAACCRLRGIPMALVSVGVTIPDHPLTRRLFVWTFRLAEHVSVRDEGSQESLRALGDVHGRGRVVPDLAFGLPAPTCGTPRPRHAVVGVMAYEGEPHTAGRGPVLVETYRDRLASALGRLVDDGWSVSLVVGDLADLGLAQEVVDLVLRHRDPARVDVSVSRARTQAEVMAEMALAHVVVASRFHNVLAGVQVGRPTVSLSYAAKNGELQADFGLEGLDQPMHELDVDLLVDQVHRAAELPDDTLAEMRARTQRHRERVTREVGHVLTLLDRS